MVKDDVKKFFEDVIADLWPKLPLFPRAATNSPSVPNMWSIGAEPTVIAHCALKLGT